MVAPATRQVAATIFASQPVQAVVVHGLYTEEFIANQCILAAGELESVVREQNVSADSETVAMGAFATLVGRMIIGGKQSDFRAQAEIACMRAAAFNVYFDRATKAKAEPVQTAPVEGEAPAASEQPAKAAEPVANAVESLGLPKTVVDLLQAAGLTTAEQVREADASGKVLAIDGIGPQAHKKIVAAVDAILGPAK